MEEKKGLNEITVLLIIIIVSLIGGLGYAYNKYTDLRGKYDNLENSSKESSEKVDKSNNYDLFVQQMKESREKLNGYTSMKEYTYNWVLKDQLKNSYEIDLSRNGILLANKKEVATNVLFYRVLYFGNGGFRALYYVTEEGKVYMANVEEAIIDNGTIKSTSIDNVEKVVNIIPGSSDSGYNPLFVDINGNIISSD